LLVHASDRDRVPELEALGVRPIVADILMTDAAREDALARAVLDAAR
jgi:hypothetical protein